MKHLARFLIVALPAILVGVPLFLIDIHPIGILIVTVTIIGFGMDMTSPIKDRGES